MKELELLEKVKKDYNLIAKDFNITRQNDWQEFELFRKHIEDYLMTFNKKNILRILDIGCGNGRLVNFLNSLNIKFEYVGIDNSSEQIQNAKNNFSNDNITFKIDDILNLSEFEDNSFDLIFCIATFHHLPSKELRNKSLKNIYRILKKDSLLLMTSWNLFQLKYIKYLFDISKYKNITEKTKDEIREKKFNILDRFRFNLKDTFIPWKNSQGELMSKRYYYAFNKTELRNLFVKNDFIIIENKLTDDKNILHARNIISILKK